MKQKNTPLAYAPAVRGENLFLLDKPLQAHLGKTKHRDVLEAFGQWLGSTNDAQAEYTDRHGLPILESFDANGNRVNHIVHNPAWLDSVREVYQRGIIGLNYNGKPAPYTVTFAMGYMLSQTDVSLHCPVTMTGAVAYVLDRFAPKAVKKRYLHELTRQDGESLTGGTWATEHHGGSDIGATTTVATPGDKTGEFTLKGLKWFTSNANGGLALATARPQGAPQGSKGLGLYLVPTHMDDGTPNAMLIRRLKDKLGTCGVPTGEIDLLDSWAVEVAPPPEGFKLMMEALGFSRIHNAMAAVGVQRRAFLEAISFASHRQAFGSTITNYPMVKTEILDILAPQEAGLALTFEASRTFDECADLPLDHPKRIWLRLSTALAKYLTAEDAIHGASKAIEVIGGNGYVYDRITPRLLRDAQVLTVWEGPANIQALELLRLLDPKYGGFGLFGERVKAIVQGSHTGVEKMLAARLKACIEAATYLAQNPTEAQRHARRLLHMLATTLAAALLVEQAQAELKQDKNRRTSLVARWYLEACLAEQPIGPGQDWAEADFEAIVGYGLVR